MVPSLMLRTSSELADKARDEVFQRGYTVLQLAEQLGLAVQLVENFLNEEIIDRNTYDLICEKLNISEDNLTEIQVNEDLTSVNSSQEKNNNHSNLEINSRLDSPLLTTESLSTENAKNSPKITFQSLRQSITEGIVWQCDRLRVINTNTSFYLHDLYTDINVFASLLTNQYIDLHEAFVNVPPEQYDQFYLVKLYPPTITAEQALEENKHILLVGGLGFGKTTLLKHWAISCIAEKTLPEYLPVFLSLRSLNIASDNPLTWIRYQLANYGLKEDFLNELIDGNELENLLIEGRLLLLWDGLDEIDPNQQTEVLRQIANFSDRYPLNRIVLATRNPVYTHVLQSFTTLEIAPFQNNQIIIFATKWFQLTCPNKPKRLEKFQQLIATNQPLAEIASNPLFLTQICHFFNSYEYIKPNFYQDILNLLLNTWEQTKCLPASHQELSISQKQNLLSYVAIVALDRHGYVWQNNQLEEDFRDCMAASHELSSRNLDIDQLFQSLKWQHSLLWECAKGVYRFPHTTLHDYLAAYRLANIKSAIAERYLLDRIYIKRWHGVIVMTISISQQADKILQLMKRKIDDLVTKDPHLQSFLSWVNQQSIQIQTPYKAVTIRALYLDIDLEDNRSLDRARALDIAHSRSLERARTRSLGIDNTMETEIDIDYTINLALNLDLALYFANNSILELACILEPELNRGLQYLREKLPSPYKEREKFAKWWQAKGLEWSKNLRSLIVQHRKGSQEWKFSDNQLKILRTYHDGNKLLIECLNNAEYVSPLVKSQIETSLLLPQSEYKLLQM
ncbi:NACHT domain-containing protein [Pseudanabaena biceps]|nr:NACHT domain-containing protein [Pseudanabaena biceps]